MKCRICSSKNTEMFLSLGMQPHCNNFLKKEQLSEKEFLYPLDVYYCHNCSLVQIEYTVPAKVMFSNYLYVSGTTKTLSEHFNKSTKRIVEKFNLKKDDLVVDIGSNDGTWLKYFKQAGIRTLGVEPAKNIVEIATRNGIETINDFFSETVALQILKEKGSASVITAAGVFFHLENLHSVVKGISKLLSEKGVLVIQAIYLLKMIEKTAFDNIYHEHLCYYTIKPLEVLFSMYGLEIFDADVIDIHGGSLELFVGKKGTHPVKDSVKNLKEIEKNKGMYDINTYYTFAERVGIIKNKLIGILTNLKSKNKKIATYGAPAKGTTLLNYCGIGTNYIDFAIEKNPLKVGLYIPGVHIPIILEDRSIKFDYYLVLPWNFLEEFLKKEKDLINEGIGFIVPIPEPKIIDKTNINEYI